MSLIKKPNPAFFPALNELRALLALGVLFYHVDVKLRELDLTTISDFGGILAHLMSSFGTYMVLAFFGLSGFLITYLAYFEDESTNQRFNLKHFYLRRLLRIWPLYYLIVVVSLLIFPYVLGPTGLFDNALDTKSTRLLESLDQNFWHYFISYVFMLPNFQAAFGGTFLLGGGHLWSIGIEEQFYIFWPLLFLLKKRYRLIAYICIIILLLLFLLIYPAIFWNVPLYFAPLIIGGLLASLYYRFPDKIRALNTYGLGFLLSIGFVIFCVIYSTKFNYILSGISFPIFILFYADFFRRYPIKISLLDEWGKISYGIYMLHPPIMHILAAVFFKFELTGWPLYIALNISLFVCTIFLCKLSYRYYEKPFLKIKDRLSKSGIKS